MSNPGDDAGDDAAALDDGPVAAAAVDPASDTLTAANRAFRALFHIEADEVPGLELRALLSPEDLLITGDGLARVGDGTVEFLQGRSRWRGVNVRYWVRPRDAAGKTVVLACVPLDCPRPGFGPSPGADEPHLVIGTVDHAWCIDQVSVATPSVPDCDRADTLGSPLVGLFHPDDGQRVLTTLGRSGERRTAATIDLRIGNPDDGWRPARLVVSPLCAHDPPRLAFTLCPAPTVGWAPLTKKPAEVFRRLIAGETVSEIAEHMFITPSTVRNHLATVFKAYDVHSQRDLVRKLRSAES
jgi:DNA-binding CsgD family transcriptional regulator